MLQKFKKSLPKAKSSQFVDMKIKTLRFLACFYFMLGKKNPNQKSLSICTALVSYLLMKNKK